MKINYAPSITKEDLITSFKSLSSNEIATIEKAMKKLQYPEYISWKKAQYKSPFKNIDKKMGYALFRFFREQNAEEFPFIQESKIPFFWQKLPQYEKFCYEFSNQFCHSSETKGNNTQVKFLKRRILRGLEEEAIASSLLEGANTTRDEAKKMIKEKKSPQGEGEEMILDNYETICWIESQGKNEAMSEEFLKKIHQKITKRTLEKEKTGRLRTKKDDIHVIDDNTGKIVHTPPSEEFIKKELQTFIDFANDKEQEIGNYFFNPLVKAIVLHFIIGYLHPFYDGNGRTARAIFYWYLLKRGFTNIGFLPISTEIVKNRSLYDKSFIYTEQENGNMTFAIDAMIQILKNAESSFNTYIKEEQEKIAQKERIQKERYMDDLNERQIEVLLHFETYPEEKTDFKRHMQLQNISPVTARNDLIGLEKKGLLFSKTVSNKRIFFPV